MKPWGPAVLLCVAAATPAFPQSYEISWWTADGGGAMGVNGGAYVLDSTCGQPESGGPYTGSSYELHGGFWALAAGGSGGGPQADLSITKSDGATTAVPGQPVSYTMVASNAGPDGVTGATVLDDPPGVLSSVSWTCSASPGSACPASGSGGIAASIDLLVGGAAIFVLTGTIDPAATGTMDNSASVTPPAGVGDPDPADNAATDTDTLTPMADLALSKSDSPDPVTPGESLTYTLLVTNHGPSTSPGMTLTDVLPGLVSLVSSSPGAPTCTHASGTVTCALGSLAPAGSATVTIQGAVSPGASGSLSNTATVSGGVPDPVSANDADTEPTQVLAALAEGELVHGTRLQADLAGAGGVADEDVYGISQKPESSYEVVVDGTSGDIGAGQGPLLERLASDGTTVLQSSQPVGSGHSRSLRFMNLASAAIDDQLIRVRSASCGSDCGSEDVYRLRVRETTARIPRFNNSATQATVMVLQNRGSLPVTGAILFWSPTGALLHQEPLSLAARASGSFNTSTVPALVGQSGSITLAHDGAHGQLNGKAVAVESTTGFTFDSLLECRPW